MLKSIELKGFKSFADKTIIDFDDGITCVVGPNGSGKSNITDAFRWVLGEQKFKSLRGSKMTDLIFSGTSKRAALGYAEVTIVFDNENKILPSDYSEISIMRRLYRSGESLYTINANPCRLKDIKELLYDTGIGVEGYSIIGQGRIDKLLSTDKADRRLIFEEASGIVKYRVRKEEASRKLDRVQQNLERINDILDELKERVGPLKEQSEKAKRFIELRDRLKILEVNISLKDLEKIEKDLEIYEKQLQASGEKSEKVYNSLLELKEKSSDKIRENDNNYQSKKHLSQNLDEKERKLLEIKGDIKLAYEMKKTLEKTRLELIEKINKEAGSFDEKISELEEKKDSLIAKEDEFTKESSDFKIEKDEFDENLSNLNNSKVKYQVLLAKLREIENFKLSADTEIIELNTKKEALNLRIIDLEQDLSESAGTTDSKTTEISELLKVEMDLSQKEKELKEEILKNKEASLDKRTRLKELELKIQDLNSEKTEITSKKQSLKRRIDNFDNLSRTSQEILKKAKNDEKLYGTIGSIITVDQKFHIALEQVLGARIENIVVEDFDTARKYIEYLRDNRLGRAVFMPLDTIRARNQIELQKEDGLIGPSLEFVSCDAKLREAVKYLLYNVGFIESLQKGKLIQEKLPSGYKLASLDGQVINVGGTVSGGYSKKLTSGVLNDKKTYQDYEIKIKELEFEIEKLQDEKSSLELELTEFDKNIEDINNLLDENTSIKNKTEADLTVLRTLISSSRKEEEKKSETINEIKKELETIEKTHIELSEKNREKSENTKEIKENISSLDLYIQENSKIVDKKREEITEKTLYLGDKELKIKFEKSQIEEIENDINSRLEESEKSKKKLEEINKEDKEYSQKITQGEKLSEQELKEQEVLKSQILDLDKKIILFREQNQKDLKEIENLEKTLSELKDEIYSIKIEKTKFDTRKEALIDALWTNYELSPFSAKELKCEINTSEAKKDLKNIKSELETLKEVNLLAIEEYEKVSERYEFLKKQEDDVVKSYKQLSRLISEIDTEMRNRFSKSMEEIKENFKKCFIDLFRGGSASILLGSDDDILNSEIIINAQPPGKKLQSLELLSGGEKALTAIAILFAILKTRPSPFCVLDEIEAALDDANIVLFSSFLKDFADNSQFIIITHRKGTMEIAESLYGVTMKEKGISKILSLKLDDLLEDIVS